MRGAFDGVFAVYRKADLARGVLSLAGAFPPS